MEDRRRRLLELDLLRPRPRSDLLRNIKSRSLERRSTPGDNKWTCTIFARRPETGEAIWAYQINPHDDHDYDGVNENILLDLTINGRLRKVLVHPDRNARMYVIDRATGEVISAETYAYQNTSEGVDLKTGRIKTNPAKPPGLKTVKDICPAPPGGKDWQPSRSRRAPAGSMFRITISATELRVSKPTILRERPMSGRTFACTRAPAAIAANSAPGIRWRRKQCGP